MFALLLGRLLHREKARTELAIGALQRPLGIHPNIARKIYDCKQQVADLIFEPRAQRVSGRLFPAGTGNATRAWRRWLPRPEMLQLLPPLHSFFCHLLEKA